jgi:2-polyprenyl-3-methyl-5-hydroxy-6-metoxy-1,4-benzoquinol methylase
MIIAIEALDKMLGHGKLASMQTWKDYFEYKGDYLPQHSDYFTLTRTEEEVDFLTKHIIPSQQAAVLDLACGQGRHAIALTKLGYTVTGVDRSEQLLSMAHQAMDEAKVSVTFVKQDMCNLDLDQTYDVILVLFCTFGIEPDKVNKKILAKIASHLNPGGRLFLDVHNLFRFVRRMRDVENGAALLDLKTLTLWDKTQGQLELPLRLYTLPELEERLEAVGLTVKKVWGNYTSEPYSFDSDRLQVLAQKAP